MSTITAAHEAGYVEVGGEWVLASEIVAVSTLQVFTRDGRRWDRAESDRDDSTTGSLFRQIRAARTAERMAGL